MSSAVYSTVGSCGPPCPCSMFLLSCPTSRSSGRCGLRPQQHGRSAFVASPARGGKRRAPGRTPADRAGSQVSPRRSSPPERPVRPRVGAPSRARPLRSQRRLLASPAPRARRHCGPHHRRGSLDRVRAPLSSTRKRLASSPHDSSQPPRPPAGHASATLRVAGPDHGASPSWDDERTARRPAALSRCRRRH